MTKEKVLSYIKNYYSYVIVIVVVVLLRTFIITPAKVDGSSMEPTLKNNNIMILNKITYKSTDIKRFDIVVIKYKDEKLIKRVIGLPGENIYYDKNTLFVNGLVENEVFAHKKTDNFKLEDLGFKTIPGDKYLVLGDNRTDSIDSRIIGLIDKKSILGKVNVRLFPLNKIGSVK